MTCDKQHQLILNKAIQILDEELPELIAVFVFGSFGTEYERIESDLDLAVLTTHSIDIVRLWNLAQEIAKMVGRNVDLIDLRQASTVFAFQVLSTGTAIYCSNDIVLANFDIVIMSMYQHLQEERKDILGDIEKGIFYA